MEGIVGVVVTVIIVISWITKAMEQQAKNNPPPQRQDQKPRVQGHLQSEIEKFLRDVQKKSGQGDWNRPETSSQSQQEARQQTSSNQNRSSGSELRPGKSTSKRDRREAARLRQEAERLSQISADDTPVNLANAARLKPFSGTSTQENNLSAVIQPGTRVTSKQKESLAKQKAPSKIINQFFTSENVKNSFIINEILQPPVSMRKRR